MGNPEEETNRDSEEPKDLVDLVKKMHEGFYKGEINSDPDYDSPREHLINYEENN